MRVIVRRRRPKRAGVLDRLWAADRTGVVDRAGQCDQAGVAGDAGPEPQPAGDIRVETGERGRRGHDQNHDQIEPTGQCDPVPAQAEPNQRAGTDK